MKIISIIYHSGSGHTTKMAKAVARGAASVEENKVNLLAIEGDRIVDGRWQDEVIMKQLNSSDAIIFGSPTYMGSVSAQFKAFADATSAIYFSRQWQDKLAAGFTVSGSPSGDKVNTLMTMFVLAAQQGMIWVGLGETPLNDNGINRLGGYIGAMGQAMQESVDVAPNKEDKLTGEALGRRVAKMAKRFHR
ncbi:flavodoxin family protein [Lusitaniella coriacea]|uniref:flavodoxin family protein n=1 Tax=Lusitaniella coriacea TaxID=1983105 RepID=UPI003CEE750A